MFNVPKVVTQLPDHKSENNEGNILYRETLEWSKHLKSSEVSEAARFFCMNVLSAERLLMLPTTMVIGYYSYQKVELLLNTGNQSMRRELEERYEKRDFPTADIDKLTGAILDQSNDTRLAVQILLQSVVSRAWSAFESFSKDVWVFSVNSRPHDLGRASFKSQQKDEESIWNGKSVTFDQLARYRFDISKRLGTLLSEEKFRMLDASGIKRAYDAAFPEASGVTNDIDFAQLHKLNKIRNLFQHSCGTIDEKFLSFLPGAGEIGSLYIVTGKDTEDFLRLVVDSSMKLGSAVDEWLSNHPVKASHKMTDQVEL